MEKKAAIIANKHFWWYTVETVNFITHESKAETTSDLACQHEGLTVI